MVSVDVLIKAPKEKVWAAITNISQAEQMISGILKVEVLEQPEEGLVGLKWQETREMFGKEATEIMWITKAVENEYYATRAESHGSIYKSKLMLTEAMDQTRLTMEFDAKAQTLVAKVMSFLMAPMIQGSIKKLLQQDLEDIKNFCEQA